MKGLTMRIEASVATVSWIPSEAVSGSNKAVFESGVLHYDAPPPDVIVGDTCAERSRTIKAWRDRDMFRFGNDLAAHVEVEDGRIVSYGYDGFGDMGATTVRVVKAATFQAVALQVLQQPPVVTETSVKFVQSFGGRTALPMPRRVSRPPFVQFVAPTVWTTLALTIHADGRIETELVGASKFPRHWVYINGVLTSKAGLADFKDWTRTSFGKHTPWGDEESPALVTEVETALERQLAAAVMKGATKPQFRTISASEVLASQGDAGTDVYLVLDGVISVTVDGKPIAEVGPGAVLGERASLEAGVRTSTLTALTKCRVGVIPGSALDVAHLQELADGHRREHQAQVASA